MTKSWLRGTVSTLGVAVAFGCGPGSDTQSTARNDEAFAVSAAVTLLPNVNAELVIPANKTLADIVVSTTEAVKLHTEAGIVPTRVGHDGIVVNSGAGLTELGVKSRTGDVVSVGSVKLATRAEVDGDLTSSGSITLGTHAVVHGTRSPNTPIAFRRTVLPLVVTPGTTDLALAPTQSGSLVPGRYASVTLKPRSTLRLTTGRYELDRLDLDPEATVMADASAGPVILLVRSSLELKGNITTSGPPGSTIVGFTGTTPVDVEGTFEGSLFAPYAALSLKGQNRPNGLIGSFFARSVHLKTRADVTFEPFRFWSRLFGLRPVMSCLSQARVDSAAGLFGYENETSTAIDVPLGPDNVLTGASSGTPISRFEPGRAPFTFYGHFNPLLGSTAWSLLGTEVSADATSPRCGPTDVLKSSGPPNTITRGDTPGVASDPARARAVPDFYGPGYSTVPMPTGTGMGAAKAAARTSIVRPMAGVDGPLFRLRLTNVTRGEDGCGDNDPVFRSIFVAGTDFFDRDYQDCAEDGNCDETFDAPLDLNATSVEAVFDVWDDDAFFCGDDDHQYRAVIRFDPFSGATTGGSLDGFEPPETRVIDAGSSCLRTRDGDGFCWSVEVVRPAITTRVCFDWPADFVDSGLSLEGKSEDFGAAAGVQTFPAARALASLRLADDNGDRYQWSGTLDNDGCIPDDRLPTPEQWARTSNFRAGFALRPVMCADPTGALCAQDFATSPQAANIVVLDAPSAIPLPDGGVEADRLPNFCTVLTQADGGTPVNCRGISTAEGAFAGWPVGSGPATLRINAREVGTKDSLTPTTRVSAVVGQMLRREIETNGDLSITLGLVERRYATGTPTIYAATACPGTSTACTSGNKLYLEPDFIQRPGVPGSNRFKFVVAHEFGHFFQFSSQGRLALDYLSNDTKAECACRHIPPVDASHCLQSVEQSSSAQSEGYAHFLAAKTWNRDTEADCIFNYYKEFLDTTCRLGAEQCDDTSDPSLKLTRPPYPVECGGTQSMGLLTREPPRWRNTRCLDDSASADRLTNQGVEIDWLAFYWGINTAVASDRWTTLRIHDAYVEACGGDTVAGCQGDDITWPTLRAGAERVAEDDARAVSFRALGRGARVDDQP